MKKTSEATLAKETRLVLGDACDTSAAQIPLTTLESSSREELLECLLVERERNLNLVDGLLSVQAQMNEIRAHHETELAERHRIESELRQAIFQPTLRQAAGASYRALKKSVARK